MPFSEGELTMRTVPNSVAEINAAPTRRGLPTPVDYGTASVADYMAGVDNFTRVMAIRPGDHVVMLTDPLLDPRVIQAVQAWPACAAPPSSHTWATAPAT